MWFYTNDIHIWLQCQICQQNHIWFQYYTWFYTNVNVNSYVILYNGKYKIIYDIIII